MSKDVMDSVENGHDRRHAKRRAEILAAATPLFFENGYARTSMDDVLNIIGGSKRTLYHHFKGKEELFAAIVSDASRRVLTGLEWEEGGDFKTSLQTMGVRYLEAIFMPETLALYKALVSEANVFPELAKGFFENGPVRARRSVVQFFEMHNRHGKIFVREPDVVAMQFIGMLRDDNHMAAVLTGKKPSPHQIRETVEMAVNTLIGGAIATSDRPKTGGN